MNYNKKYIKYKTKYLKLKLDHIQVGGTKEKIDQLIHIMNKNFYKEVDEMKKNLCIDDDDENLKNLIKTFEDSKQKIIQNNNNGLIDPFANIVVNKDQKGIQKSIDRKVKVGYFPTAADPLHWAHLLTALEVLAKYKLDKIVFIVGGQDPRKPNITDVKIRHPMAKKSLDIFGDFFAFSDISTINDNYKNDGETNMFLDLKRNKDANISIDANYIVGSDHFNWTIDKDGVEQDDTIKKLYDNSHKYSKELGNFSNISAIFIARDPKEIEGKLDKLTNKANYKIHIFYPQLSFSSTEIRKTLKQSPLIMIPMRTYIDIKKNKLYGTDCEYKKPPSLFY